MSLFSSSEMTGMRTRGASRQVPGSAASIRESLLTPLKWWVCVLLLLLVGRVQAAPQADEGQGLSRRQADVRDLLMDVAKRMDRLAERLQPTQPEDAGRLKAAAERVTVSRVEDVLKEIESLLQRKNFVEAVGRQDRALEELDQIIALLEEARFKKAGTDDRLREIQAARREVTRIANRQEGLLEKTRKAVARAMARKALQDLTEKLGELGKQQAELNQHAGLDEGKDPSTLDPQGTGQDRAAMEQALERVEKLLEAQKGILRRMGEMSPEDPAASQTRKALEELKDLMSRAEELGKPSEPDPEGDAAKKAVKEAEDLLDRAQDLAKRLSGDEEARQAADRLEEAVSEGREALEKPGEPGERVRAAGERLSEKATEAGRELGRALRKQEEGGGRESAALAQEQGLLERETGESSQQLGQEAQKGSSESARTALSDSSQALQEASRSMRESAENLSGANREAARQAADKARESLEQAREALTRGMESLASRGGDEAASDLQKKLARETDKARERVDMLQKKLGKKEQDPGQSDDLDAAKKALAEASNSMQQAAGARQRGDQGGAQQQGRKASEQLDKARQGLARKDKELTSPGPEESPLPENKEEQDELARLTRNVAKKLSEDSGGESGESSNMQSAAGSMDKAGQDLARKDAESAEKNQEDALKKLRNSQQSLEEKEQELASLNREREMVSLLEELTKFREKQESINVETVNLKSRQEPDPSRRQRMAFKRRATALATSQETLGQELDTLNARLEQELSRVFSFILRNVSSDMRQVVDLLRDSDLGAYTLFLEKEIIQDLDRLLNSLKDELARMQEQKQGPPMPFDERRQRLVPVVAELRMLKEMQTDVNRRTRNLEDLRQASESEVSDPWKRSLDRLLQKQGSISRMTGKLVEDFERITREEGGEQGEPEAEVEAGEGE